MKKASSFLAAAVLAVSLAPVASAQNALPQSANHTVSSVIHNPGFTPTETTDDFPLREADPNNYFDSAVVDRTGQLEVISPYNGDVRCLEYTKGALCAQQRPDGKWQELHGGYLLGEAMYPVWDDPASLINGDGIGFLTAYARGYTLGDGRWAQLSSNFINAGSSAS